MCIKGKRGGKEEEEGKLVGFKCLKYSCSPNIKLLNKATNVLLLSFQTTS